LYLYHEKKRGKVARGPKAGGFGPADVLFGFSDELPKVVSLAGKEPKHFLENKHLLW
jgi:hypothetical protein